MSKSGYVAGLRGVEQLLAGDIANVRRVLVEYRAVNPRVKAVIASAREKGIDVQEANRARLRQISGEARHQGVIAGNQSASRARRSGAAEPGREFADRRQIAFAAACP